MRLTLKIDNMDALPDGGPLAFSAVDRGFTLGRDPSLPWTLPDPANRISNRHGDIRWENGAFFFYDISSNGTFLNGSNQRIKSPYALADGDRLTIGHYVVSVSLSADNEAGFASGEGDGIWASEGPVLPPINRRDLMPPRPQGRREADFSQEFVDFSQFQPAAPPARAQPPYPAPQPFAPPDPFADNAAAYGGRGGVGADPFRSMPPQPFPPQNYPPQNAPQQGFAPQGFPQQAFPASPPYPPPEARPMPPVPPVALPVESEPFGAAPVRPRPVAPLPPARGPAPPPFPPENREVSAYPVPQPPQHLPPQPASPPAFSPQPQRGEGGAVLERLARGAGIPVEVLTVRDPGEVAEEIGQVLRILVEELAELLKGRSAVRRMTKASRTMVSLSDNNPLKFIPRPEEVLEVMFAHRRGYMDARRSVSESFGDIRKHEVATYVAMQRALAKLLEDMSPEAIEKKVGASTFSSRKSRAWDLFVAAWMAKTEHHENGMLDVFLTYFGEAYEKALTAKKEG